jgi:hypothetical protein
MFVFLICLFTLLAMLFAVLAYGAINDGQRHLFMGIAVFALVWVTILGGRLVFMSESPPPNTAANASPATPEAAPRKATPVAPKPGPAAVPAVLPMLATKGTSFHLTPGESSPMFRITAGKKAHVSVFGGGMSSYSGGQAKLVCDTRSFTISGTGDGNQFVACETAIDVLIDDIFD